jgi:CheY-like chemotaxis protein
MLSARGEEYDRINSFEIGVDDYVLKPFSPRELMLRINAIMGRSRRSSTVNQVHNEIVEIEGLRVDVTARIVYVDGKRVDRASYIVKPSQIITINAEKSPAIAEAARKNNTTAPAYLEVDLEALKATLIRQPEVDELPLNVKLMSVVEYYAG